MRCRSPASSALRTKAKELKARNDIQQLSASIQAFKTRYQVSFVPSTIMLKNGPYNVNNQFESASLTYLKKVWPRLQVQTAPLFDQTNPNTNLRSRGWFPDDPNASANSVYVLEGWQCLVFFLGGIQHNGTCLGFSTNKTNPTLLTGQMEPLLFDFPPDRLNFDPSNPNFLGFQDPYGTVYAYFSSVNGNDYNIQGQGDCPSLGLLPYVELLDSSVNPPIIKFVARDSFQIIQPGATRCSAPALTIGVWALAIRRAAQARTI